MCIPVVLPVGAANFTLQESGQGKGECDYLCVGHRHSTTGVLPLCYHDTTAILLPTMMRVMSTTYVRVCRTTK